MSPKRERRTVPATRRRGGPPPDAPRGRRAGVREGGRALGAEREREGRRIAKERTGRLFEACRRLEEELDIEHASHAAYDAWRARDVAADGSRRMARDGQAARAGARADRVDEHQRP